jgi:hypothetical protein
MAEEEREVAPDQSLPPEGRPIQTDTAQHRERR